jgi:hypothetical protein
VLSGLVNTVNLIEANSLNVSKRLHIYAVINIFRPLLPTSYA